MENRLNTWLIVLDLYRLPIRIDERFALKINSHARFIKMLFLSRATYNYQTAMIPTLKYINLLFQKRRKIK